MLSLTVPAVGATSGTVATKFTFDAPVTTSSAPGNTPDTHTVFLTLAGLNFGVHRY